VGIPTYHVVGDRFAEGPLTGNSPVGLIFQDTADSNVEPSSNELLLRFTPSLTVQKLTVIVHQIHLENGFVFRRTTRRVRLIFWPPLILCLTVVGFDTHIFHDLFACGAPLTATVSRPSSKRTGRGMLWRPDE
jgi:hypothetical protein